MTKRPAEQIVEEIKGNIIKYIHTGEEQYYCRAYYTMKSSYKLGFISEGAMNELEGRLCDADVMVNGK